MAWYVIATANYQVGQPTSGQLLTRQTSAATPAEVTVCRVDRPGNTGDLIVTPSEVFPTNDITARQEPYAFDGANPQKFGFMPGGSYEALLLAEATTAEVIAARQFIGGGTAPVFDPLNPQTTGLPDRLNTDLSGPSMATRLGLRDIVTPSNTGYSIPGTVVVIPIAGAVFNPGDFVSTSSPVGSMNNAVVLSLNSPAAASPNVVVDVAYGTFTSGLLSKFPTGPSTAITGTVVPIASYLNVSGSFSTRVRGEQSPVNNPAVDTSITSIIPAGIAALIPPGGSETSAGAIATNTGGSVGITADSVRNVCHINRTDSGQRLVDPSNGFVAYGRLDYATGTGASVIPFVNYYAPTLPASLSATFVAASPTVVINTNPVGIVSVGDIIQLPVTTVTMTLVSISGFNVGDLVSNNGVTTALGLAGTVTLVNGITAVSGVGTAFTSQLSVGSTIVFSSQPSTNYIVLSITDDQNLILTSPYTGTSTVGASISFTPSSSVNGTGSIASITGSIIVVSVIEGDWLTPSGIITDTTTSTSTTYSGAFSSAIGDGRYYQIVSMDASPKITIFPSYAGSTNTVFGNLINRSRFKLNFVENTGSGEVPLTFLNPVSTPLQFFFPAWFNLQNSNFDASLFMKTPGDPVNDATTTAKGRTLLAPNNYSLGPASNTANDTKAGMIVNIQASGASVSGVTGNYHTLNFQTLSSNITAGPPGVVNIAATGGTGPAGPPGPTGPTGGTGPAGPVGPGFSTFLYQSQPISVDSSSNPGPVTTPITFSFAPKMAAVGIAVTNATPTNQLNLWVVDTTISTNTVSVQWSSNYGGDGPFPGIIWVTAAG